MSVVLVTGAGGFVGSAIVRRLVRGDARFDDGEAADHVVALLRPGGSPDRLRDLPSDGTWSVSYADVLDRTWLESVLASVGPRAVVHAALDERAYGEVDESLVRGVLEVLVGALRRTEGGRLVHVGSAWVLASGNALHESAPLDPLTPYARNKAREDALLPQIAADAEVPWINLRLFNLFGRFEKPTRLIPTLVSRLSRHEPVDLTHGAQIRDFNDVDAVAEAFAGAVGVPDDACGSIYHIGSGVGTTVRSVALMVAEQVGGGELIRFGTAEADDADVPCLVADPRRAQDTLGWRPDLDLAGRIREAVAFWQEELRRVGAEASAA